MPARSLPVQPNLDHLKNQAKALRDAFARGEAAASDRVAAVLGSRRALRLTEAQRVLAREHGFATWAALRTHVQASRGLQEAVRAFLAAAMNRDRAAALNVLRTEPRVATTSVHAAAVLGAEPDVRRLVAEQGVHAEAGMDLQGGDPLLWLCYSPFHGETPERDAALAASARALLDAGADPNTRDAPHGVPALYAVTGVNDAPRIARMLLEAGARPNDGESLFHAAERFHEASLELLLEFGADVNFTGDWGNTPLYFLLRYWDVATMPLVERGVRWLLDHGADPDVVCTRENPENSLHVAVRRGQHPDVVQLLLDRGADVHARTGRGRTAWVLARRGGFDALAALLEAAGAQPEVLLPADELIAACGRGDIGLARTLASPVLVAALEAADLLMLPESASQGKLAVVTACLEAGFPVNTMDEAGATAMHHAAIHGHAAITRELLSRGADITILDREHSSIPLGWACFGADFVRESSGDYEATVQVLLDAGAQPSPDARPPEHAGVRELLQRHARRPEAGLREKP